jgi:hypothetical protein
MAIHNNYSNIDRETRKMVDDCFQGVFDHLSAFGYKPSGDDRAEHLVEAIATYIVESKS